MLQKSLLSARNILVSTLAAAALLGAAGASAADAWPSRPIRVVVPFATGASGDIAFRMIQPLLEKKLGTTFYIDNKSGASGNIGAADVARAAPDGYTLLLGATNNFVTNQYLFKLTFDPLKSFAPVTMVVNSPLVAAVNVSLPVKTLAELKAYSKKNAGKVNFGSPGVGAAPHLAGLKYAELTGAPLTHVPYRGAAPAVQALLAADLQVLFVTADSLTGYINAGKLRGLAVAGPTRLKALPDVPTTAEAGVPGLIAGNWWGLAAPAGTDPAIINKLSAAVKEAVSRPEIVEQFAALGTTTVGNSPAEFAAQMAKEAAGWKVMIEQSNIKIE